MFFGFISGEEMALDWLDFLLSPCLVTEYAIWHGYNSDWRNIFENDSMSSQCTLPLLGSEQI